VIARFGPDRRIALCAHYDTRPGDRDPEPARDHAAGGERRGSGGGALEVAGF
jgi:hypothetical protein